MKNLFKRNVTIYAISLFIVLTTISCEKEDNLSKTAISDDAILQFTDIRDLNVYKYKKIGDDYWMIENLRYDPVLRHYHCNNDSKNLEKFGYLYEWGVASSSCPPGWHLPSKSEWAKLIEYLGGEDIAGGKLKNEGTEFWQSPNTEATNESGFNALPGGYHDDYFYAGHMGFIGMNESASFWSVTSYDGTSLWRMKLTYDSNKAELGAGWYKNAYSIRCVKDQ